MRVQQNGKKIRVVENRNIAVETSRGFTHKKEYFLVGYALVSFLPKWAGNSWSVLRPKGTIFFTENPSSNCVTFVFLPHAWAERSKGMRGPIFILTLMMEMMN